MSSIRSASSITRMRVSDSRIDPRSNMSSRRPGVAIRTSTPFIRMSFWSFMLSPPMIKACVSFRYFPYWTKFSATCKREFARRLQDQAARHAGAGARARQDVQHRQGEAGGLAGAGLRRSHHVPPHQHERDRLLLDRGRVAIPHLRDRAQHLLGQMRDRRKPSAAGSGGGPSAIGIRLGPSTSPDSVADSSAPSCSSGSAMPATGSAAASGGAASEAASAGSVATSSAAGNVVRRRFDRGFRRCVDDRFRVGCFA